jgi:hypothetical protein
MEIRCQRCGHLVLVGGIGRRRLNISVKNVTDTLRAWRSVSRAAEILNCSRGLVYLRLREGGFSVDDFR